MIHLIPNTSPQTAYFSPFQARKHLASFSVYLLIFENVATKETFPCILNVIYDNERYTSASLPTDTYDPVNGEVLITQSGLYTYTIYGQTSDTNLDPNDASVVGICEIGAARFDDQSAWNIPTLDIPDNVIYYE